MSRIQNILEKAERDGAVMRTGRMVPFEPPVAVTAPAVGLPSPVKEPTAATVLPSSTAGVIAPAAAATSHGGAPVEEAFTAIAKDDDCFTFPTPPPE